MMLSSNTLKKIAHLEEKADDANNDKAEDVDSQLHPNSSDSEEEEGIGFTNGLAMLPSSSSSKNNPGR